MPRRAKIYFGRNLAATIEPKRRTATGAAKINFGPTGHDRTASLVKPQYHVGQKKSGITLRLGCDMKSRFTEILISDRMGRMGQDNSGIDFGEFGFRESI